MAHKSAARSIAMRDGGQTLRSVGEIRAGCEGSGVLVHPTCPPPPLICVTHTENGKIGAVNLTAWCVEPENLCKLIGQNSLQKALAKLFKSLEKFNITLLKSYLFLACQKLNNHFWVSCLNQAKPK
jgi:hypothetical protein